MSDERPSGWGPGDPEPQRWEWTNVFEPHDGGDDTPVFAGAFGVVVDVLRDLIVCPRCGCVVHRDLKDTHTVWHANASSSPAVMP